MFAGHTPVVLMLRFLIKQMRLSFPSPLLNSTDGGSREDGGTRPPPQCIDGGCAGDSTAEAVLEKYGGICVPKKKKKEISHCFFRIKLGHQCTQSHFCWRSRMANECYAAEEMKVSDTITINPFTLPLEVTHKNARQRHAILSQRHKQCTKRF
uniref:Uncharacterized protein TCIL3000_10_3030 n=1 Tax=Trypanosoma congolense (strain IL3000) TaxID=1068625 RepID=G0UVX6_TRYCI|nr:unnamed protein product [Trypanosoma congolense IL3000]